MRRILLAFAFAVPSLVYGQANEWTKLPKATIEGRRWDVPLGYAPDLRTWVVLGGRSAFADYRKPRSYDVLHFDEAEGVWENAFPADKDWGPKSGAAKAPAWTNENFGFADVEKNVRPNWTVYGTFHLGQQFAYDSHAKAFVFYAGGKTFRYDPLKRVWSDLAPESDPAKELGGILLWSSMAYDSDRKQFLLFGGGNLQSERGDPGAWTYDPAANRWTQLRLKTMPPPRALSRMVYDPSRKKFVLFGGDQLDQLLSDTWTFDPATQTWEERKPANAPAPRAGHALLWLPKAKKIGLVGGFGYTSTTSYVAPLYRRLPLEAWIYDPDADRWDCVKRWTDGPKVPDNVALPAAVDDQDRVLVLADGAWRIALDAAKTDAEATATYGVKAGTVERRTDSHDPQWYRDVPPADATKTATELASLPANRWVVRPTPKRPGMNMDWGSAVYAPELHQILRFSGGHSAYSGTAPQVYDVKTDRWSIPFAPEYPLEFVYSNDQVHGEWSFKQRPWMTGHTYKSTGYDPNLRSLVFAPHEFVYFFDSAKGAWTRSPEKNPYRADFYNVTVASTPKGAVVWADSRSKDKTVLWRLDPSSKTWKPLPAAGEFPGRSPDHHGMAYDSKRDRLLFASDVGKRAGDVAAYDFATGRSTWLDAKGRDRALVPSREAVYVPLLDGLLVGGHVQAANGSSVWPFYDCAANAWIGLELPGDDPVGKGTQTNAKTRSRFNNSMGLMVDAERGFLWGVGQYSQVHVLKLEPRSLVRRPLAD